VFHDMWCSASWIINLSSLCLLYSYTNSPFPTYKYNLCTCILLILKSCKLIYSSYLNLYWLYSSFVGVVINNKLFVLVFVVLRKGKHFLLHKRPLLFLLLQTRCCMYNSTIRLDKKRYRRHHDIHNLLSYLLLYS